MCEVEDGRRCIVQDGREGTSAYVTNDHGDGTHGALSRESSGQNHRSI